jgi:hypothetical protein
MNPFVFLVICVAGWMDRDHLGVIEYLQEEIRELKELLGKKPRFNDVQPSTRWRESRAPYPAGCNTP